MTSSSKVTLIATVKNEERSIKGFLDSIKKQTRKPDEILIVDANSTDKTVDIIENQRIPKLRVLSQKGNRSKGRNTAIKASMHDIITVSDAGCVLDKHWLERIVLPFQDASVSISAGFYKPKTHTVFEKSLATYTCTMPDKLNPYDFLPSSRSVAFRKSAWKKVKGYPEYLDTCEDLVFAYKAKKLGMKFVTVSNAIVYWPQRKNIIEAAVQFFNYAQGDGRARYFRKNTPILFGRYIFGFLIFLYAFVAKDYFLLAICFVLFFLYFIWAILKNYKYVKHPMAFLYLPLLQLVSDICVISGTIIGILQGLWATQNKQ